MDIFIFLVTINIFVDGYFLFLILMAEVGVQVIVLL